jgi:hypothetical protein
MGFLIKLFAKMIYGSEVVEDFENNKTRKPRPPRNRPRRR